jgi:lipopolysaccharide/colanic/teichoic acid biosynthesis glycosyltransferase
MSPLSDTSNEALARDATATARTVKRPLVAKMRFQLGGALLLGVGVPVLLSALFKGGAFNSLSSVWEINTSFAAAVALIYGYYGIVQFRLYPGARATAFVLPSLAVSFGIVALAFVLARVEYSRFMFVLSFVLGTTWFYLVLLLRSSRVKPRLALVPCGDQRDIDKLTNADWYQLTAPDEKLDGIEGVVVDLRSDLPKAWSRFVARCVLAGVPVYDVKNVSESLTGRIEIGHLSESNFGSVLPSNIYRPIKRLLDLLLVAVLGLPSLVLIVIFATLIRWETPGPVFFTQSRMGYRGKTFTCWKLRSMRTDAAGTGSHFTEENDPRITRVGRFIRKYRIDELPQIWNIIRGDMSWIGPRPEAKELAEWYATEIPFYIYRHAVRPGISGWAQVNQGNVAKVDAATVKLQYDFFYIKNFSPWLDLLIFVRTLRTIATGFGSR